MMELIGIPAHVVLDDDQRLALYVVGNPGLRCHELRKKGGRVLKFEKIRGLIQRPGIARSPLESIPLLFDSGANVVEPGSILTLLPPGWL